MIGHQGIGQDHPISIPVAFQGPLLEGVDHLDELAAVVGRVEDLLPVDAAHHDMILAAVGFGSGLSWHAVGVSQFQRQTERLVCMAAKLDIKFDSTKFPTSNLHILTFTNT